MSVAKRAVSSRQLVERFAGHLAHLLNTGEIVEIRPHALYQRLAKTLESQNYARLSGLPVQAGTASAEDAALKYLDTVLDRQLWLARANHTHMGHDLFLALCQRGLDASWQQAGLSREGKASSERPAIPIDYDSVADRLANISKSVSLSNPAANTRKTYGPLWLLVGTRQAEVAEELSVWKAIECAPNRLKRLEGGVPFDRFCSVVIKAVEAANAPFGAILALGLSPYDWAEELTVNTAKKLGAFLAEVRKEAGVKGEGRSDIDTWRLVWQHRQVPGYASADALWQSELGRALRLPQVASFAVIGEIDEEIPDPGDPEAELLDGLSLKPMIAVCQADGAIDIYDAWLLNKLAEGTSLAELETRPETRLRFGGNTEDFAGYVEDLYARLIAHAKRRERAAEGDDEAEHPDTM